MSNFLFELSAKVRISANSRDGKVTARCEYDDGSPNLYTVEYLNGDGDLTSAWFKEQQLVTA